MAARHRSWLHYVWVWAGLVLLTTASFLFSYAKLGTVDTVVALMIAVTKTTLVLAFFMHLAEQRFTHVLVPVVSAGFVVLLVLLMAADVATRHTFPPSPVPVVRDIPSATPVWQLP